MTYDVVIIGAGAAGLMAARELAQAGKKVAVVEALARTGGRMATVESGTIAGPIDLGAEFVHGNLPLTKALLQEAGATLHLISGTVWQHQEGTLQPQEDFIEDYDELAEKFAELENDLPVADFMAQHLQGSHFEALRSSLQGYVEGYYAADTTHASTLSLAEELGADDEPQYRIEGGYAVLVRHLEEECRSAGVPFFLNHSVQKITWQKNTVEVFTDSGSFRGSKALITVSLGVLQAGTIHFSPGLPAQQAAARALGFGHVVKINLLFRQPFWKDARLTGGKNLADLQFLFSDEAVPTWWSQNPLPAHMLTGWLGGPKAKILESRTHEELLQLALHSLAHIFGLEPAYLWQDLLGAWSHNWSGDACFMGAYSYEVVSGNTHQKTLQQPVEDTIYFAGEALHHGPELGTVEAALQSGKETAAAILSGGGSGAAPQGS